MSDTKEPVRENGVKGMKSNHRRTASTESRKESKVSVRTGRRRAKTAQNVMAVVNNSCVKHPRNLSLSNWSSSQLCSGTQVVLREYHIEKFLELCNIVDLRHAFNLWKNCQSYERGRRGTENVENSEELMRQSLEAEEEIAKRHTHDLAHGWNAYEDYLLEEEEELLWELSPLGAGTQEEITRFYGTLFLENLYLWRIRRAFLKWREGTHLDF